MKEHSITVRLSEELFAELLIKAKSLNLTNSDFVRSSIMNIQLNYKTDQKDYGYLIGALNRIGNNFNQIAHNLNVARNQNNLNDYDYEDLINQLIIINSNIKSLI